MHLVESSIFPTFTSYFQSCVRLLIIRVRRVSLIGKRFIKGAWRIRPVSGSSDIQRCAYLLYLRLQSLWLVLLCVVFFFAFFFASLSSLVSAGECGGGFTGVVLWPDDNQKKCLPRCLNHRSVLDGRSPCLAGVSRSTVFFFLSLVFFLFAANKSPEPSLLFSTINQRLRL